MNNFLQSVTSNISKAVDYVVEKNHKTAMVNRIRVVIKNERENAARAYVALGKYYFEHLRDAENEQTEHLCRSVEESERRMKNAFSKLDEITAPSGVDDNLCADCTDDCDACPYFDGLDDDFQVAPAEESFTDAPKEAPAEGEDDIVQPPFVNEVHDDAAAEEEQQMADTPCAEADAEETIAPEQETISSPVEEPAPEEANEKAEATPEEEPAPEEANEKTEANPEEEPAPEEANEKTDAAPAFDGAAARRSVAATIDIATSVVKDVASMAKDFAASVAGTVSKVAKDGADLLKDSKKSGASIIYVSHTEVPDAEDDAQEISESAANIIRVFHQDSEEEERKAQEAALQEMEARIRKADEKAQEFEAKLHEQDVEQPVRKTEEPEPEFEMGVHRAEDANEDGTTSSILEMFSTEEEAADDESDGTPHV